MKVKFLKELNPKSKKYSGIPIKRLLGHCLENETDATIVADTILKGSFYYLEKHDNYDRITSIMLHELIHKVGRWYPNEFDNGLFYSSPIDKLVNLIMEMYNNE